MKKIFPWSILWVLALAGAASSSVNETTPKPASHDSIVAEIKELEEKQQVNPLDPDLYFILGSDYWALNDFDKAVAHFKKVVHLDPEYYSAHWNLSVIHNRRGEGEDAIIHMKKAEEIFLKTEDVRSLAKARKELRGYFIKYQYRPEDFELPRGFLERIFN